MNNPHNDIHARHNERVKQTDQQFMGCLALMSAGSLVAVGTVCYTVYKIATLFAAH